MSIRSVDRPLDIQQERSPPRGEEASWHRLYEQGIGDGEYSLSHPDADEAAQVEDYPF